MGRYAILQSIRPSVSMFPIAQKWCILGLWLLYRTLIGNPVLEVEPTGQSGHTTTGSGRNSDKAVDGAASEAFARWLHRGYARVELPWRLRGHTVSPRDTLFGRLSLRRNRKALESRSLADDERITFLETQLKEAKYISEDADRKYDEVRAAYLLIIYC